MLVELEPKRRCPRCGAILRRSNPGPLCAPCHGVVEVPDWATAIVEADGRPTTVTALANALRDPGGLPPLDALKRNEEIYARYLAGESQRALGEVYGLTRTGVAFIVNRMRQKEST